MAGFQIELDFAGGLNSEQKKIFNLAAMRWQEIITGPADLKLLIIAAGQTIDGPGRVLGRAGPTSLRDSDGLPVAGVMEFDSQDLDEMQQKGSLKAIILHEMAHVIGIGTLWKNKGVLKGSGTNNPEYIGANATREYAVLLKQEKPVPIPVANTGGPGTAEGHWRETTFDDELMTGYAEDGRDMPLSRMTVGGLQDLGYVVNYDAADDYELPPKLTPAVVGVAGGGAPRHYCKVQFPDIVSDNKSRRRCCCCF